MNRSDTMGFGMRTWAVWMVVALASAGVQADILVLEDPLQDGTRGYTPGGATAGEFPDAGGWKVTNYSDAIVWHLNEDVNPGDGITCPSVRGTIYKGRVQFRVKGINPNECRPPINDKSELFHMYDWTFNNSDSVYMGGYRDNPFKHFIRKTGCLDTGRVDMFELVLVIAPNYEEPDAPNPIWNPNTTYVFTEDWGPDPVDDGNENCELKTYVDVWYEGFTEPSNRVRTMSQPGSWSPEGHALRIGMARTYNTPMAPVDAIFSHVKVWDRETAAPATPVVTYPIAGKTINTTSPCIRWAWKPGFNQYQVRITSGNNPDTDIVWNSNVVLSTKNYVYTDWDHNETNPANLANLTNYYVWVKLGNIAGWSSWSSPEWFRVDTSYTAPNHGITRIVGQSLADNRGPFLALGFTYMEGLGFCKRDRDRFESDVAFMASRGFNHMRILSEVPAACPQEWWWGREINASDYRCEHLAPNAPDAQAWDDYDQQFRDMVDIAYDKYGVRTEVTIFGGAGLSFPTFAGRQDHCQRILDLIAGREHKIAYIEIANEAWQTGFPWPQGKWDLRSLCQYVAERTTIPVAITSPRFETNEELMDLYLGSAATIATEHFSRDLSIEDGWYPVRACWRVQDAVDAGVPPVSSDEPVGPGSSVTSETHPIKLVSAACFAWIAKLPAYVFHSNAGVRGDYRFEEKQGVNDYRFIRNIIPADVVNWSRYDAKDANSPFNVYCNNIEDRYWTDIAGANDGCHRLISGVKCNEFVSYVQGIRSGGLKFKAERAMSFEVYDPHTGQTVNVYNTCGSNPQPIDTSAVVAGQTFCLPKGNWDPSYGAYIIKGTFPGTNTTPPGSILNFAASGSDGQVTLTWQNPNDADLWGVKIVYRTDRYPTSLEDGTVAYDNVARPGRSERYVHKGLENYLKHYYYACAYDCAPTPNYSGPATAIAMPEEGVWRENFTYPNGPLNGNSGWQGSCDWQIRIANETVAMEGGAGYCDAIYDMSYEQDPSVGHIKTSIKVKKGVGTANMWGVWFNDPAGRNLARWYGAGTTARGRIGGTNLVTDTQYLTGDWDTLEVKIRTGDNASEFFFNGDFIGTLDHTITGASDTLGQILFEHTDNAGAFGSYLWFDDLVLGEPRVTGDFDRDRDVDQEDFGFLQECFSGDAVNYLPGCESADLDVDEDVDLADFDVFYSCLSGPRLPSPCAGS